MFFIIETKQVNKIECKGSVPQGRSAHTAVVYNNDIYIFGGWNGGASNNEFFRYNIGKSYSIHISNSSSIATVRVFQFKNFVCGFDFNKTFQF
jgi:hypothetical protein